ncbi:uncharacterized protein BDR25DRAFT_211616, partial [Lindgomyces ingoldianus]
ALFSGPHRISALVGDYKTVLIVTSSSGIVAQLLYLKQLIYRYNACKGRKNILKDYKKRQRSELQDQLKDLVRTYLDNQMRLLELEYQPA